MRKIPAWVTYTLLRLLLFVVPLIILLLFNITWWVAIIIAAIIGLAGSYIFLARFRNQMSTSLYEARARRKSGVKNEDESFEDSVSD